MKRISQRTIRLLSVIATLLLTGSVQAQDAVKPNLVPGSSDTIHDVMGIAIGMSCEDSVARAVQISVDHRPYSNNTRWDALLDGRRETFLSRTTLVSLKISQGRLVDSMRYECVGDGSKSEVYKIQRNIVFGYGNEALPAISSVGALFQEKYGLATITYSPTTFVILFNRKGAIENTTNPCIKFSNDYLYESFVKLNADACSYRLSFVANKSNKPGFVNGIIIEIEDYMRLENAVRRQLKASQSSRTKTDLKL